MAMKTIKSNWHIEVRPAAIGAATGHVSDEICEGLCDEIVREMIDGRCPEIPAHCVKVKYDEKHICNSCKRPWSPTTTSSLDLYGFTSTCLWCGN